MKLLGCVVCLALLAGCLERKTEVTNAPVAKRAVLEGSAPAEEPTQTEGGIEPPPQPIVFKGGGG